MRLAVDATLVSALDSAGHARVYQRRAEGAALRPRRGLTVRSFRLIAAALSLSDLKLVAAGASALPGPAPALCQMTCKPLVPQHAAPGGRPSFVLPPRGRMPPAFLPCPEPARTILMGSRQMSATSLPLPVLRSARVQSAACARTLTALRVDKTTTAEKPSYPGISRQSSRTTALPFGLQLQLVQLLHCPASNQVPIIDQKLIAKTGLN